MSPESDSHARLNAVEASGGDESVVEGPLHGYHHETYVFPLPGEKSGPGPRPRWKCREPRPGLLWFDRRCFASEEQLLKGLSGRIDGIPDIIEDGGLKLQRFIEGRTLGSVCASGLAVPEEFLRQIVGLFRQLVVVTPETLSVDRRCKAEDRPDDGDSDGFLERLVCFTEEQVYQRNLTGFERLFKDLGVDAESFKHLRKHVSGLRERPFCLLHADLHRENFIVDDDRVLWTIDWELAMVGDPLYDLATHLHLMRYPARQARAVAERWAGAVERARPGSAAGWRHDVPLLLGYKRAQSLFTDVIRVALSLDGGPEPHWRQLVQAALKLRRVLADAALPLGLESVPGPRRIVTALVRRQREHGRTSA
ncbi:phosphotransferase [Streptomyces sp. NPDC051636]|uniref:phosphotransferase n=1 Tax=Streptomyces sp. NPDC051636 TaxID=3365663 RepID=UPI0037882B52